jgi:hypothetical protein
MTKFAFLCAAVLAVPVWAQQDFNRNSVSVGFGTAAPSGKYNELDPGTALELNLAHRFTPFIQADFGFETSFNKDYRNYYPKYGTGLATTTNFFVPAGGRIVIPLLGGRIEPSFGLGGVYRYDKANLVQPSSYQRNQGGVYGLVGATYALDSAHKHRVGLTLRYINIMSAGTPHPQWWNLFGEYTYSWGE